MTTEAVQRRRKRTHEKPNWKIRVYLDVTGFEGDPAQISEILGITPTGAAARGDPVSWADKLTAEQGTSIRVKGSFWSLKGPSHEEDPLADQLRAIMRLVSTKASRFQRLPKGASVELYCVIFDRDRQVVFQLPQDVVRDLAAIGAGIGIDYYATTEPER